MKRKRDELALLRNVESKVGRRKSSRNFKSADSDSDQN